MFLTLHNLAHPAPDCCHHYHTTHGIAKIIRMLFIVSHNLCNHTPLRDSQRQGIRDPWPSPCGSAFSSWSQQKYCLVHPFPTTQAYHCFWQMLVLFGDRIFPVYGSIKCFSKATFLENKVRFIQMNIELNEMETVTCNR